MSKVCCFTGHRPDKSKYGYDIYSEDYKPLLTAMYTVTEDLIKYEDVKTFITGGALEVDTMGFVIVNMLKEKYPDVKNIVAVPFEKQYIS